jgi:hypothetical protein
MSFTSSATYASLKSAAEGFKNNPKLHLRELCGDSERVAVLATTHESKEGGKVRMIPKQPQNGYYTHTHLPNKLYVTNTILRIYNKYCINHS